MISCKCRNREGKKEKLNADNGGKEKSKLRKMKNRSMEIQNQYLITS